MDNFLKNFFMLSQFQSIITLLCVAIVFLILYFCEKRGLSFSWRIFIALMFGIIFGVCLQFAADFPTQDIKNLQDTSLHWLYEVSVWFNFFITLFINFLRLFIIPMIFIGIISVVLQLSSKVKIGSLLSKTIFWLLFTTGVAASIGVILGYATHLGEGIISSVEPNKTLQSIRPLHEVLISLVPNNIIEAMRKNNIIGVVIFAFCIAFGMRAISSDDKLSQAFISFKHCIEICYQIIMKIALGIIKMMPYAIVFMSANVLITNGFHAIASALHFIILIYLAGLIMFVVYGIILFLHGLNPFIFFKKALPALFMAFTSRSSVGSLPVTLSTLENLGVSKSSANFGASLGATIGMNGCAGYLGGLIAVFIYNALGLPLHFTDMCIIVILCVIASIGIAGIPGISIMVISVLLEGLGLQSHFALLAIILAIDPITDMMRTLSNVTGAMIASIATDKEMNMLDINAFNAK